MENIFLIKIGEIALKGGNRGFFEKQLAKNIKLQFKENIESLEIKSGRYYLTTKNITEEKAISTLKKIFGIVSFAKCYKTEKKIESILQTAEKVYKDYTKTETPKNFKAEIRRADKSFPLTSYQLSCEVGNHITKINPELKVQMKNPDFKINIEIREQAYIYANTIQGAGGLPVGTAGKATLLLSGGIDSPVAAYMMAKRGLKIEAVYFHTYPYTSDDAMNKVKKLAQLIAPYCGGINLFCVNFTEPQLYIKKEAKQELTTLLSRSAMMEIASKIAEKQKTLALITGEALSQVASQTPQSLRVTGSHATLPVFRPCIGLDKEEIIQIARNIGTFETSILPHDDCCTLFSPEHPETRPDFQRLQKEWAKLTELQQMIENSAQSAERFYYPCNQNPE